MSKTFTLGEAQVLLPVLESLVNRARSGAVRAGKLDSEMQELSQRIFLAGGLHVDVAAAARRKAEREKAVQEAKDTLSEIEQIGVSVQDLGEGILDFPCVLDGETVLLCWQVGELEIGHWHGIDEGAETRRPLGGRLGPAKLERPN